MSDLFVNEPGPTAGASGLRVPFLCISFLVGLRRARKKAKQEYCFLGRKQYSIELGTLQALPGPPQAPLLLRNRCWSPLLGVGVVCCLVFILILGRGERRCR